MTRTEPALNLSAGKLKGYPFIAAAAQFSLGRFDPAFQPINQIFRINAFAAKALDNSANGCLRNPMARSSLEHAPVPG